MNFTYCGADLKKTIKSYEKIGNNYIIDYLDGHAEAYFSLKENEEEKLLKAMTNQAILRMQNMDLKTLEKYYAVDLFSALITGYISINFSYDNELKKYIPLIIIAFIMSMFLLKDSNSKIKELKKYKLFLEIAKEISDSEILKVVEHSNIWQIPLNIKTIDSYNFREVKAICKEYKKKNQQ